MSVRERVLASRLSERIAENRKYAERIGVSAVLRRTDFCKKQDRNKP